MSTTRRGLLRGALTGGAATLGLALASEAALADPAALLRGATTDTQLLFRLLEFEHLEEFAYARIGQTSVLPAKAKPTVAQFLAVRDPAQKFMLLEYATQGKGEGDAYTNPCRFSDQPTADSGSGSRDSADRGRLCQRLCCPAEVAAKFWSIRRELYQRLVKRFLEQSMYADDICLTGELRRDLPGVASTLARNRR